MAEFIRVHRTSISSFNARGSLPSIDESLEIASFKIPARSHFLNPISSRLQASSRPSQLEQNRFPPLSILVVAKKFDRRNLLCTGCWKVFWLFLIFSINQTITQRNNPRYNDETFHDFTRRWGEMMWPMMIVPLHVLTRILIIVHKLMDKADDRSFHRYFCTAKFLWRYF